MNARTVVIDSQELTRAGFRFLLQRDGRGSVVGEADDARSGYVVVERERPDVAVVDLWLGDADGIAATRELRRRAPGVRVLVVGASPRADQAIDAFDAGAGGVAGKRESGGAIIEALLAVARGETYLTPELPIADLNRHRRAIHKSAPLASLSARERDICDLFCAASATGRSRRRASSASRPSRPIADTSSPSSECTRWRTSCASPRVTRCCRARSD